MRLALWRSCVIVSVGIGTIGVIIAMVYRSMQQPPQFYQEALAVSDAAHEQAGDRFEQTILQLSNQMRMSEYWSATLTEEEINGWMAADLPNKFPGALPDIVESPRIAITDDQVNLAFRVRSKKFNGIVHIRGSLFCTDKPNQIAIHISNIRSGMISVPINFWAERIQRSLEQQGIVMSWIEQSGNPIALVDLPKHITQKSDRDFVIHAIQLDEGLMRVFGRTCQLDKTAGEVAQIPADKRQY